MSIEQEAAEILEKAADGFESGRYGWTKGKAHARREGQDLYCSVGALYYEAGLYDREPQIGPTLVGYQRYVAIREYMRAEQALAHAVGARWEENGMLTSSSGIPGWNDYGARTVDQVIDKMKEAAKELRNQA